MDISGLPTASTIDPINDVLPIVTANINTTQQINRNTFLGLSSTPVGLTDTQTLTSKTLTSPTINGATLSGTLSGTYTIGGTPTFPSSVVTLTGSQTLTNKVLTSPTINSPTITNATYSGDTIVGYTSATSGTVYGMSVVSGVLASSALVNTVNTAALQTNAVVSGKLGLSNSFTGGVTSYTNTGSGGGTGYYINLGGLKLAWGQSNSFSTTGGNNYTASLPTSFFSSVQSATFVPSNASGTLVYLYNATSTSTLTMYISTTATGVQLSWTVIGT